MILDLMLLLDHDISNCKSSKHILKVKRGKETYCQAIKGVRHEIKNELAKELVFKRNTKVNMAEMMNIASRHKERNKILSQYECESAKNYTNKYGMTFNENPNAVSSVIEKNQIEQKNSKYKNQTFVEYFNNNLMYEHWQNSNKIDYED